MFKMKRNTPELSNEFTILVIKCVYVYVCVCLCVCVCVCVCVRVRERGVCVCVMKNALFIYLIVHVSTPYWVCSEHCWIIFKYPSTSIEVVISFRKSERKANNEKLNKVENLSHPSLSLSYI